jgi:HSP20 family protein
VENKKPRTKQEEGQMFIRVHRYPVFDSAVNNPFAFDKEIEDLVGDILNTAISPLNRQYPAVDLAEYEKESVIVAEMPGVSRENLKLSIQDGAITISGERKDTILPEGSRWMRNEIRSGQFSRTLQLPHEVKADAISAELTDGILSIVLPKAEKALPREISVQ